MPPPTGKRYSASARPGASGVAGLTATRAGLAWLLHVGTGMYVHVSSSLQRLLGYAPETFLTGGIEFPRRLLHPADAGNLGKLQDRVVAFLRTVPPLQRVGYQCNYDYRLRKSDGTYVRLLEQSTVLHTDARGEITYLAAVCTDITHWKKNEVLTASVISPNGDTCLVCTSADGAFTRQNALSKREKEILGLVGENYTSREIAERLFISLHTVNTHRRNLVRKTSAKTGSGLVRYALING